MTMITDDDGFTVMLVQNDLSFMRDMYEVRISKTFKVMETQLVPAELIEENPEFLAGLLDQMKQRINERVPK
jgi:hypothetical protein